MTVNLDGIREAARRIAGHVVRTPLVEAPRLGEITGARVSLKLENMQATGSFKDRGAYNMIASLQDGVRQRGVIAASAGNHAQGVAWHARGFGVPATIVMPAATPFTKIERTSALGAEVVLHGDSLLEADEHAQILAGERGLTVVHPYDDDRIIEGQGTIALEILEDDPDIDTIVTPIGGGGLIGGVAVAAKALKPGIRVVGVQAASCPAMHAALEGHTAKLRTHTIADGIAVKRPGERTKPLVRDHVDEIVLAPEEALERAVQTFANVQRLVVEGAGAAPLAALLTQPAAFTGRRVCLVVCGGNIDARLLANVLQRGLRAEGRIARLRIEISDKPGVLSQVTSIIGATGADIIEISHQRLFSDSPAKNASLDVVVEAQGRPQIDGLLAKLRAAGFPAESI